MAPRAAPERRHPVLFRDAVDVISPGDIFPPGRPISSAGSSPRGAGRSALSSAVPAEQQLAWCSSAASRSATSPSRRSRRAPCNTVDAAVIRVGVHMVRNPAILHPARRRRAHPPRRHRDPADEPPGAGGDRARGGDRGARIRGAAHDPTPGAGLGTTGAVTGAQSESAPADEMARRSNGRVDVEVTPSGGSKAGICTPETLSRRSTPGQSVAIVAARDV